MSNALRRRAVLAGFALLFAGAAGAAAPGPGQGPDPALEAISPAAESVDVGLAGTYPADITRYVLAQGAGRATLSPDGRLVAVLARTTGVPQLWIVPATGGAARQLTFGNGVTSWRWLPDGQGLVYAADNDGDEQEAYFRISIDGRREQRLLAARKGAFRVLGDVLPNGRELVFASTERNGLDFDIHVLDLASGAQRRVFEGRYGWYPHDVSPDGRFVIVSEAVGEDSQNLYLLELGNGALRVVAKPARRASTAEGGFAWLPDSSGFFHASNEGREFAALVRYDIASGRSTVVDAPPWDVHAITLCGPRGSHLLWATNEDGFDQLHGRDLASGTALVVPPLPEGVKSVSCPAGSGVAAVRVDGWATPGDLVAWDFASGRTTTLWTANLAGLDPARFVRPEVVRAKARDGVTLQGLLYLPRADSRRGDGPPPVVFDVHGGPTAQSMATFEPDVQYLVNRGIAVFTPNVRGSTGFGHTYSTLDDRERRLDSIRDLVDLLAALRADGRVDARRAAVRGGSYGGYAVNAVLAAYPGEFVAGVSLYGVADWVTALEVASPSLKAADRIEYGDIAEPRWREFYSRISPIRQADRITVPVLFAHGAADPRIDIYETETMVRNLRARGIEAPYIRYPDEGHGWRKLPNRLFHARREAAFLEQRLGAAAPVVAQPADAPVATPARAAQLAALQARADRLADAEAIRRLQRAYGYYVDKGRWDDAAALFTADAPLRHGPDGSARGTARIRALLASIAGGAEGPAPGILNNHFQLQPVVSVAADGRTAVARWRQLVQRGRYGKEASWAGGPLDVTYVNDGGTWKIASMQWRASFVAPYAGGWVRSAQPPRVDASPFAAERVAQQPAVMPTADLPADLAPLDAALRALESRENVENLHALWGHLRDAHRWDDAAALFARDATYEVGQRGVYRGRDRVRAALALDGPAPIPRGLLDDELQLQPLIHVGADGTSAQARWRTLTMAGRHGSSGLWGSGVQENRYVVEDGRWRIAALHAYTTFRADYDRGWSVGALPVEQASATLPADAPPTEAYGSLPDVHVPPFHYANPVRQSQPVPLPAPAADATTLARTVTRLQDLVDVQQLQRSYGYYVDKRLWDEAADLFAGDATLEIGGRGVFVGKARIREYLGFLGNVGPERGWLYDHSQWQLVPTIADDGRRANARLRAFIMGGSPVADPDNAPFGAGTVFGEATYENAYVKEGGIWKIAQLQAHFNFYTPYSAGWGKAALPNTQPEEKLPPDRPPTRVYETYPAAGLMPFHYANPVTGR